MNKWLTVVLLVLLALTGAMGLRHLTASNAAPVLIANGTGPIPPSPF